MLVGAFFTFCEFCFFNVFFNNHNIYSQEIEKDTISSDSLKTNFILDEVRRKAKGFIQINNKDKIITLYDNAELYYMDIELKSGIIKFNWESNIVSAGRIRDSVGNYTQSPVFKQGGDEINVIEAGKNYGWPSVSYGTNYLKDSGGDGVSFKINHEKNGFEEPLFAFVPSVGISNLNNCPKKLGTKSIKSAIPRVAPRSGALAISVPPVSRVV